MAVEDAGRTGSVPRGTPSEARHGTHEAPWAVTIDDVARLAGVSTATVTRALQGHPHVRPETRARVEHAATRLGYVPHLGARALATRTSETIGLLVPSSADGFWGEVADGLEARAREQGFSTLLATAHRDAERERSLVRLFVGKRVDGIVIGSAAGSGWLEDAPGRTPLVLVDWEAPLGPELLESARSGSIEAVLAAIDDRAMPMPVAHVRTDDFGAARDATRHLLALGHRAIAFAGLRPVRPAVLRFLGVRAALEEAGLRPAAIVEAPSSLDGGRAAGAELLSGAPGPTAVLAFDDMVAVGIMRAVHAAGLVVPRDLSVIGFDDVAVAAFVEPPLTTIRQHKAELGSVAFEVVLAGLDGPVADVSRVLPGTLVVRDSTAPPPT